MIIEDIYRLDFMKNSFSYIGCLRNEKQFNIGDNVFFAYNNHDIIRTKIVGIELLPQENPEYKYKVTLPESLIRQLCSEIDITGNNFYKGQLENINVKCTNIFNSLEDAKKSAIKNLESMFKLQSEEIEKYFEQFEKQNK